MRISEAQKWVKEDWERRSKQVNEKDELIFLMEEIGEMAEAYEKVGEWKLAYEAWNKTGKDEEANQAYQKAKAAGQI